MEKYGLNLHATAQAYLTLLLNVVKNKLATFDNLQQIIAWTKILSADLEILFGKKELK